MEDRLAEVPAGLAEGFGRNRRQGLRRNWPWRGRVPERTLRPPARRRLGRRVINWPLGTPASRRVEAGRAKGIFRRNAEWTTGTPRAKEIVPGIGRHPFVENISVHDELLVSK